MISRAGGLSCHSGLVRDAGPAGAGSGPGLSSRLDGASCRLWPARWSIKPARCAARTWAGSGQGRF